MKLTPSQKLMVADGFPKSLFLTPAQRAQAWADNPPHSTPLIEFNKPRNTDDEATAAFRAQEEERRKAQSRAKIDRMKARFTSRAIDHSKMRWDPRRAKFVEDVYVSAPDQGVSRPPNLSIQGKSAAKVPSSPARPSVAQSSVSDVQWSRVNKDTARHLAELNGVWDDKYLKLSGGLLVMTVANRLKGLVKKGEDVRWS